jgi:hypothetical protein
MDRSPEVEAALEDIRTSTDPDEIRALVQGASEAGLHFRPAPSEWSIVEILRHLGDTEEIRQMRFDRMLAEDNPLLERPEPEPGERDSEDAGVLFARWERLRSRALERLSAMSEDEWRRGGTQAPDPQVNRTQNAPTTVLNEAGKINRHSADHLQQMRANLAAFETSASATH